MRRVVLIAVGALVFVPLVGSPARAGGYCPEGFSVAKGNRVWMAKSCFGPTVLRVEPGEQVTFVNNDAEPHSVGGVAGSFGDAHREVFPDEVVRFSFDQEGVFPYFCVLHPGMAGAIVVGDGLGSAEADGTVASELAGETERAAPAGDTAPASGSGTSVVAAGFAAAVAGFAGGLTLRRRRRPTS
jgi:plastocyanin